MGNLPVAPAPLVDLLDDEPLEVELATTLVYEHSHYPYRQIRSAVEAAGERIRREIIDVGLRHRGKHDEMLRPFCAGQQFRFDILMDIGGFRDMHRHRRCVQIGQEFTTRHGYDTPQNWKPRERGRTTTQSCSGRRRRWNNCLALRGRGEGERPICDSTGVSQADVVQNGFR